MAKLIQGNTTTGNTGGGDPKKTALFSAVALAALYSVKNSLREIP